MQCPVCNYKDTKVNDSRISSDGMSIRRRRECLKCGYRFSTTEEVEILDLAIIKRDGRREPYSREKMAKGLKIALEKRPITDERFKKLLSGIERDLQKKKKREITSADVGEIVMKHLKKFDKIAYIRFASVYRSFEDVETFKKELAKLSGEKNRKKSRK